jgi:hypothetical protein
MLLAEVLLVSRILGLVAGEQRIEIQPDATVARIEVLRDSERVATLDKAPWRASVNFGQELAPHGLTVIAFDAQGQEVGRDVQAVNVARPPAELGILLERQSNGELFAALRWAHFAYQAPKSVVVKLDGKTIHKSRAKASIPLGWLKDSGLHVLGAEVTFPDGVKSRKEIVFGGGFSEQMPAELTPIGVRLKTEKPNGPATCFRAGDAALPPAPIERGEGAAHFIINGRRRAAGRNGLPEQRTDGLFSLLDNDIMIVNPVAEQIDRVGGHTFLFASKTFDGTTGTRRLLMRATAPNGTAQIADAVGAAALRALRGGQRRVVVVVIGDSPANDHSVHSPATIRRYLQRIGVPLRVWSLSGPRPDLAATWGEARDVSTAAGLLAATEDLRNELESQRVAWLPVGPLDAFRVVANGDCAYAPLAGAGYGLATPSAPAASAR